MTTRAMPTTTQRDVRVHTSSFQKCIHTVPHPQDAELVEAVSYSLAVEFVGLYLADALGRRIQLMIVEIKLQKKNKTGYRLET